MLVTLTPHPDTPFAAIDRIEVDVGRREEFIWLRFAVYGDVGRVRWPEAADPDRADDLWRQTCFEVFVPTDDGYREFNLSPSGAWASYRFDGYRTGMAPADERAQVLGLEATETWATLEALIEPPPGGVCIGLSAVIEEIDGGISYWALAHPPGKPDFHHPDSFALILPPPEPA
ncbi:MAG: DOMON-like domain-containing protein [Brevundimonas sp.]|uniref:DOMON-like domain-containing protein n=1 Tax=Brevundimonas sp. TaxID=1871086 RepID=UPI002ABC2D71|nr:DOMON-like domain-containing protein [Brevundimonas sp.]MDZ4110063.1 DOMON-like domain-containing protein [Brevundimonas sp.]